MSDARDRYLAARCGVPEAEVPAFLERLKLSDEIARVMALEDLSTRAAAAEGALDSRAGMLARVERVIEDLIDQLGYDPLLLNEEAA